MERVNDFEITALADFRRRVADLYAAVRHAEVPVDGWRNWRAGRDQLFATHVHSPLVDMTPRPREMSFWDYDPTWRVMGRVGPSTDVAAVAVETEHGRETFSGVGRVAFEREGRSFQLPIYWADSYGGGFFLPFRDETNGVETFGSGRYLLDGAKSADLGGNGNDLVLDFNFAYHPSCVWGSWVCPLPAPDSRLDVPVRVGERAPTHLRG